MANTETKQLDSIISSRRALLAIGGAALAGLAFAPKAEAQAAITDTDILNFALNLEYLEAQFYNLAASGVTIDKLPTPIPVSVNGGTAGTVTLKPSFAKVPFALPTIAAYATETALEEGKHVSFLQGALSTAAVSMPDIDLFNSFNALASVAGIGSAFDPFASDANFLIGAYIFEDVGVSAYHGAAGLIQDKKVILPAAVGIHAVEAYHAGLIRTSINALDAGTGTLNTLTQKISAARSMLANPSGASTTTYTGSMADDIGLTTTMVSLNGTSASLSSSTIVDCDSNSIGWGRTTSQVLAIVTGTDPSATSHKGVFFPSGLNGNIK
ncbi:MULTISPECIES: ferritin-like domain-containing protein [Acidobacteriaceae]|uniref:ferritin-like domain-containing protein n=1 Tax=Acidobacteriaceae TaxID=204434 RepID=UPI00131C2CE2|nr:MULTISPECIES: ferritin-like domain-containing protein [Acidobacteriaceae]MDW5267162.1 ferritin-like domain-containing protein [Edaphobacter sp.]